MDIILLHSAQVEASRAIVAELVLPVETVDSTATKDGRAVRVVGKHALAVAACPNFSAYPAIVVKDGETLRVKSPVGSWAEAKAFIDAPAAPATPKRILSQFEFSQLFTGPERIAMRDKAAVDKQLADILDVLNRAEKVDLDHPATVQGLGYAASVGCLTAPRRDAVLRGEAPA